MSPFFLTVDRSFFAVPKLRFKSFLPWAEIDLSYSLKNTLFLANNGGIESLIPFWASSHSSLDIATLLDSAFIYLKVVTLPYIDVILPLPSTLNVIVILCSPLLSTPFKTKLSVLVKFVGLEVNTYSELLNK
mgnify:CR=1 FL=1